jgi:hypothetical protein
VQEEKACPATEPAFHDLTILQPYFPPVSAFPSPLPSPMLWMDRILYGQHILDAKVLPMFFYEV